MVGSPELAEHHDVMRTRYRAGANVGLLCLDGVAGIGITHAKGKGPTEIAGFGEVGTGACDYNLNSLAAGNLRAAGGFVERHIAVASTRPKRAGGGGHDEHGDGHARCNCEHVPCSRSSHHHLQTHTHRAHTPSSTPLATPFTPKAHAVPHTHHRSVPHTAPPQRMSTAPLQHMSTAPPQ